MTYSSSGMHPAVEHFKREAVRRYIARHGERPSKGFLDQFRFYTNSQDAKEGELSFRRLMHLGEPRVPEEPAVKSGLIKKEGITVVAGCGPGDDPRWLQKNGYGDVIGIDVNESSFELGHAFYGDAGTEHPRFVKADVRDMSSILDAGSVKNIYSCALIHSMGSVNSVIKFLEQSKRVLEPGGVFFGRTLGTDRHVDNFESLQLSQKDIKGMIGEFFIIKDFKPEYYSEGYPGFWAYFLAAKE